jgi:DNA-binding NarL/FixJ family response regulator
VTVRPITVAIGAGLVAVVEVLDMALSRREGVRVVGWDLTVSGTVEKVRTYEPQVALVFADLPHWDGIRACADIKRLAPRTRVLVAGMERDDCTLLSAVKAGADGFVTVGDSPDDLVDALHQVAQGESHVPPPMLGALLRGLIDFRREDDAAVERFASLGKREREVLAGLVNGLGDAAIAAQLHLSPHTTRTHTQNILTKLGVHSRLEATRMIIEHDLLARFRVETDGFDGQTGRRP